MFGADPVVKDLRNEVAKLRATLETTNLAEFAEQYELAEQVVSLKQQVTELEIQKSKKDEDFARQQREIDHKIGLERKRAEQDNKNAIAEAKLAVREANLDEEKTRVQEQMDFMEKRLNQELDSMRHMTEKVMDFIPKVEVDRRIREDYTSDKPKVIESGE